MKGSIASQVASVTAGTYLAVLWLGMAFLQRCVRAAVESGDLVTSYNSYEEEPGVVRARARVGSYSIAAASFALGAYLYTASRDSISVYIAVACMVFFGGSYAVYAAWPNKPKFIKRLIVRRRVPGDRVSDSSFDAPARASQRAHLAAALSGLAAAGVSAVALRSAAV